MHQKLERILIRSWDKVPAINYFDYDYLSVLWSIFVWGFEKCNNFSICRQIKISQKYFYPRTYLPTETFDLVSDGDGT